MSEPTPRLVLHIGQQMMDVADWEDFDDYVYWDDVDCQWRQNAPGWLLPKFIADKLNRMRYDGRSGPEGG